MKQLIGADKLIGDSDKKKGATPAVDAAPCCFIQDNPTLRDLDGLGDLLLRLHLRHGDGQDTVLHLGRNLIFHDIIR